jgi:hypothetical protein
MILSEREIPRALRTLHDLLKHEAAFLVLCESTGVSPTREQRQKFVDGKFTFVASMGFSGTYTSYVGWSRGPTIAIRRWNHYTQKAVQW